MKLSAGVRYAALGLVGAVVLTLLFFAVTGSGQRTEPCSGPNLPGVGPVHVSTLVQRGTETGVPSPDRVEVQALNPSPATPRMPGDSQMVVAIGPLLGSMDSPDVKTNVACSADGDVTISAMISRSHNFTGSVTRSISWRPKLTFAVSPIKPSTRVSVVWTMSLDSGSPVHITVTPPFDLQVYPITASTLITGQP